MCRVGDTFRDTVSQRWDRTLRVVASTTRVEIDTALLARLRERHPGKDDRSLIEDLARIELGFASIRDVQRRSTLDEDEATELAVRAVHEARRASA